MTGQWDIAAIILGVVVAAIAGGTFFAFSNFVMPALSTLATSNGISAMQAINRAAPSPLFVATLLLGVLAGLRGLASLASAALYAMSLRGR